MWQGWSRAIFSSMPSPHILGKNRALMSLQHHDNTWGAVETCIPPLLISQATKFWPDKHVACFISRLPLSISRTDKGQNNLAFNVKMQLRRWRNGCNNSMIIKQILQVLAIKLMILFVFMGSSWANALNLNDSVQFPTWKQQKNKNVRSHNHGVSLTMKLRDEILHWILTLLVSSFRQLAKYIKRKRNEIVQKPVTPMWLSCITIGTVVRADLTIHWGSCSFFCFCHGSYCRNSCSNLSLLTPTITDL